MHYQISGGLIKSEYAAKPAAQASQYLIDLLKQMGPFRHALDFGCGKLRYASQLYHLSKNLTVADSAVQLDRIQTVIDDRTSVREYVDSRWYDSRAIDLNELRVDSTTYDFILCTNVLSAIPDCSDRIAALRSLRSKLRKGSILVVCQYTNSYFCEKMRDPTVHKYNDGFLLGSENQRSFYGLINLPKLEQYLADAGFNVKRAWRRDQSAYATAR